jgi:hypothetical protein
MNLKIPRKPSPTVRHSPPERNRDRMPSGCPPLQQLKLPAFRDQLHTVDVRLVYRAVPAHPRAGRVCCDTEVVLAAARVDRHRVVAAGQEAAAPAPVARGLLPLPALDGQLAVADPAEIVVVSCVRVEVARLVSAHQSAPAGVAGAVRLVDLVWQTDICGDDCVRKGRERKRERR